MVPPKPTMPKKKPLGAVPSSSTTKPATKTPSKPSTLPPNPKSKSKSTNLKSKKSKKGYSLADILLILALFLFSGYALRTCPSDALLEDSICRGLSAYKEHVVEPYVMPVLRDVRRHPTFQAIEAKAEATYDKAVPVVNIAFKATKPLLVIMRPIVERAGMVASSVWNKAVYPRLRPHIRQATVYYAQAEAMAAPYIAKLYGYYDIVMPYIQTLLARLQATYITVRPHVIKAYEIALPYMQTASQHALKWAGEAAKKAGALRKEYVDVHLSKMWAKVMEGKVEPDAKVTPGPVETLTCSVEETVQVTPSLETTTTTVEKTTEPSAEETIQATSVDNVADTSSMTEDSVPVITAPSFISDELAEELSVSAEAARAAASPEVEAVEFETPSFISDELAEELSVSAEAARAVASPKAEASPTPSFISEEPAESAQVTVVPEDSEDDIDDFLLSLGFASSSSEPPPVETKAAPPDPETERARIAAKRADIKVRHAKHQIEIEAVADEEFPKLRMLLMQIRSRAVAVMFGQAQDEEEWDFVYNKDGEKFHIADGTDHVKAECAGLVGGLERYLEKESLAVGKLDENMKATEVEKKKERFETVFARVDEKWRAVMTTAEERVVAWVQGVREQEFKVCLEANSRVKNRAEKAQANLGLDYAWLEDVTYHDWQEYHQLMDIYKDFRDQVKELQENTHERPVGDPLNSALPTLQENLRNEVAECQRKLREVKKKATKLFSGDVKWREATEGNKFERPLKADADAFLGKDKVQVESALRGVPVEPLVSILPVVVDEDEEPILPVDPEIIDAVPTPEVDASKIFVGKDAKEVEAALNREEL